MTRKLYYLEPFLQEWDAEIKSVTQQGEHFIIELDQTAFFPEGGGQPCDRGLLAGIEVLDVFEKEDVVYHVLPKKPQNKIVHCVLDFERRWDHTVQHSGEHLLSGVFHTLYGGRNAGFHLGVDYVTIDIDLEEITTQMCKKAETIANEYIYKDIPVRCYFVSSNEIANIPVRKQPNVQGEIRIVDMGEGDCIGCCGTHVESTGQIGIIKIIKSEKYKGMTRIYLKCGKRALEDFERKQEIITELVRYFSTPEENLLDKIKSDNQNMKEMQREIRKLKEQIFSAEAEEMLKTAKLGNLSFIEKEKDNEDIQILIQKLLQKKDFVYLAASLKEHKLYLAHSGKSSIHCGKLLKEMLQNFEGKGGGSDKNGQISFQNEESLMKFYYELQSKIQVLLSDTNGDCFQPKIHEQNGNDIPLEEEVVKLLMDKNLTISSAESCTGGLLAGKIINFPGASAVFMEGAITYSNEAKIRQLNVKEETLYRFGAVSAQCAKEMAEGIAKATSTNIGVSVTGIAGPGGGSEEKPVGLVYLGFSFNGNTKTKELRLIGDRQAIRNQTVIEALNWILGELK